MMPLCSDPMTYYEKESVFTTVGKVHPTETVMAGLSWVNLIMWSLLLHFGGPLLISVGCAVLSGALCVHCDQVTTCTAITSSTSSCQTTKVKSATQSDVPEGVTMVLVGILMTAITVAMQLAVCSSQRPEGPPTITFNLVTKQCIFLSSFEFRKRGPRSCSFAQLGRVAAVGPHEAESGRKDGWCVVVELSDGTSEILDVVSEGVAASRVAQWTMFASALRGTVGGPGPVPASPFAIAHV